jgi:TonB-like protein
MTRNLPRLAFIVAVVWTAVGMAQNSKVALPMVAGASVPLYPPLARAANVQGVVHVKITTDGHSVSAAHAEDGHKLLAVAAEENARTWQFATHEPTTFTVTYHYRLDAKLKGNPNNPTVILRLPTEVEISIVPLVLDTTAGSGTPTTR